MPVCRAGETVLAAGGAGRGREPHSDFSSAVSGTQHTAAVSYSLQSTHTVSFYSLQSTHTVSSVVRVREVTGPSARMPAPAPAVAGGSSS